MKSHISTWKKLQSGTEIRGNETAMSDDFARKIGYTFATMIAEQCGTTSDKVRIAVGRDPRLSGKRLTNALINGMRAADSDILDCGLCTTPALYRMCDNEEMHVHGAVMVTASNRNGSMNGFKFVSREKALLDADIDQLISTAEKVQLPDPLVRKADPMQDYIQALQDTVHNLLEDDSLKPLLGMRVVVDASNGSGGCYEALLRELGADTDGSLNLEPDGNFPGHEPDNKDADALEKLRGIVLEKKADLGLLFDSDCGRVSIIGEDGNGISENRLIALVARILLEEKEGITIVTDSVTSSGLTRFITEWGGIHYRYKRGYQNVINEARRLNDEEINCPLAIETSGHAAFRENGFLNDGMYLATRIICKAMQLKWNGEKLCSLIEELNEPVEKVEVRLPIIDEDYHMGARDAIEVILSHTLEDPSWRIAPDNREGARILFDLDGGVSNAWFQLRLSVYDPVMPLNAESAVEGGTKRILKELYALMKDMDILDLEPLKKVIGDE